MARAYVAGAGAGVEAADVAGVEVLALVTLAVMALTSYETDCRETSEGPLSTNFSERKSLSFKFRILTPVAASSRTVGMPSRTVTRMRSRESWKSSSMKGA